MRLDALLSRYGYCSRREAPGWIKRHSITFKGAYHFSPDHTHWTGYAAMQADLTFIRDEARRLRAEGARHAAP